MSTNPRLFKTPMFKISMSKIRMSNARMSKMHTLKIRTPLQITLFLTGLLAIATVGAGNPTGSELIAVQALGQQSAKPDVDAPLVLDVRAQAEFDQGHLPSAVLIPHDQPKARRHGRLSERDPARPVAMYRRTERRAEIAER